MADVAPRSERLCAAVVPAGRSTTRSWRTDTRLVIRPRCRPPVDRSYPPTSPGDYCLDRCRCSLEKPSPRPLEICSRDGLIRMSAGDLKRIALLSEVLVGRQAGITYTQARAIREDATTDENALPPGIAISYYSDSIFTSPASRASPQL